MQTKQLFVDNIRIFCVQYLKLDWFSCSSCRRIIFFTSLTNDLRFAARSDKMYCYKKLIIFMLLIVFSAMKGRA
jgi:hypothetical protein